MRSVTPAQHPVLVSWLLHLQPGMSLTTVFFLSCKFPFPAESISLGFTCFSVCVGVCPPCSASPVCVSRPPLRTHDEVGWTENWRERPQHGWAWSLLLHCRRSGRAIRWGTRLPAGSQVSGEVFSAFCLEGNIYDPVSRGQAWGSLLSAIRTLEPTPATLGTGAQGSRGPCGDRREAMI